MSIRIGILGYGNLGRGIECAIKQNPDMELAAVVADEIFVMRNSNLVERAAFSGDYSVFHDPYSRMLLEASGLVDTSTDWNDKTKERIDLQ